MSSTLPLSIGNALYGPIFNYTSVTDSANATVVIVPAFTTISTQAIKFTVVNNSGSTDTFKLNVGNLVFGPISIATLGTYTWDFASCPTYPGTGINTALTVTKGTSSTAMVCFGCFKGGPGNWNALQTQWQLEETLWQNWT
jgi:hypothetical protein